MLGKCLLPLAEVISLLPPYVPPLAEYLLLLFQVDFPLVQEFRGFELEFLAFEPFLGKDLCVSLVHEPDLLCDDAGKGNQVDELEDDRPRRVIGREDVICVHEAEGGRQDQRQGATVHGVDIGSGQRIDEAEHESNCETAQSIFQQGIEALGGGDGVWVRHDRGACMVSMRRTEWKRYSLVMVKWRGQEIEVVDR